jgi:acyl dehydratase
VILSHRNLGAVNQIPGIPDFNPMMILHGEEKVELFSPIEVDSTVVVSESVEDLQDKGKATVIVVKSEIRDKDSNELKARIFMNIFIRGIGGFGRKGTYKDVMPKAPKTAPTNSSVVPTDANQAFFYRLCGDRNPLHVDPQMSEMGGFKVPILHGLCTYGVTARSLYETYFKGDTTQLKSITGRFTSHVFPGETLIVDTWKNGNTIVFNTRTKERGKVVLTGYATLKDQAKM